MPAVLMLLNYFKNDFNKKFRIFKIPTTVPFFIFHIPFSGF